MMDRWLNWLDRNTDVILGLIAGVMMVLAIFLVIYVTKALIFDGGLDPVAVTLEECR